MGLDMIHEERVSAQKRQLEPLLRTIFAQLGVFKKLMICLMDG
jgi:hypothetical protein